nr:uncharacterized protein LOC123758371 [Procambarus clarkii]
MALMSVGYAQTATYYWGSIDANMSAMPTDSIRKIQGPFGFGTGISLDMSQHQCMVQEVYNKAFDNCSANPANCPLGFSLSVWVKVNITDSYYSSINQTTVDVSNFQTIVSTGESHSTTPTFRPLYPLVSHTPPPQLSDHCIHWTQSNTTVTTGRRLFVMQKKQAQRRMPSSATAKNALSPPKMMVGCHTDADDTTYRNFLNAQVDELATWTKELNDTETLYFMGGYAAQFASSTPADFQAQVSQANMKDPETAATLINGLNNIINDQNTKNTLAASSDGSSTTAASPTQSPEATASFQTMLNIVMNVTSSVFTNVSALQCNKILGLYDAVSSLFAPNNQEMMLNVQQGDNSGSAGVMQNLTQWTSELLRQVNSTTPINFTKVTDNMLLVAYKRNLSEWRSGPQFVTAPDYSNVGLPAVWDFPYDRAAVSSALVSDPACANRAINLIFISSRTYDRTAFDFVNEARMTPSPNYIVDSHTLTVNVTCDAAPKGAPSNASSCQPSADDLLSNPVRLKLRHTVVNTYPSRALKFHQGRLVKEITARYCVWWNPNLSDFGVWDSSNCVLLETTEEYTKCACAQLGTFAVMAKRTPPKVVPVDATWLTVLRYVGYSLSFLFIIFYIIVVLVSRDLKDQFHVMGLNLAIVVLLGAVFMLVSDLNSVRANRHTCTAIGTLIHLFYQAAGAWIFSLGCASFSAITSGVIGGRLHSYIPISWGLPLISVGVTYLFFLFDLGEDPRCFISWANPAKIVFFGFQMFFVSISFICATIVLCNMATPALRKDNLIDDYGSFCKGAAYVVLFFDVTWIFGLLCYLQLGFTYPDFYPIFQVLNSWTGLVIFLFMGMGSRRFNMVVAGQAKLRRQMLVGYAFGTPGAAAGADDTQKLGSPDDQLPTPSHVPGTPSPSPLATPSPSKVAGRPSSRTFSPVL